MVIVINTLIIINKLSFLCVCVFKHHENYKYNYNDNYVISDIRIFC